MRHIDIFDTTLRDGEQVPGASLNVAEKLDIARHLDAMGVDVIEAGFPITSRGDFDAVQQVSRETGRATIAALARSVAADVERAGEARFERQLVAYRAAPEFFKLRMYLDNLVEGMAGARKFFLLADRQTVTLRFDFTDVAEGLGDILGNE
jgi:isopropylmalate/homocitrate/citramalate synthase